VRIIVAWEQYGIWHIGELLYGPTVFELGPRFVQVTETDRWGDLHQWVVDTVRDESLTAVRGEL